MIKIDASLPTLSREPGNRGTHFRHVVVVGPSEGSNSTDKTSSSKKSELSSFFLFLGSLSLFSSSFSLRPSDLDIPPRNPNSTPNHPRICASFNYIEIHLVNHKLAFCSFSLDSLNPTLHFSAVQRPEPSRGVRFCSARR